MSDDNAAENSPRLQHPDVLVPPLRENTLGAVFVTRPLPVVYLTARTCACFQNRVEGDVARQDHMSTNHVTPSAPPTSHELASFVHPSH